MLVTRIMPIVRGDIIWSECAALCRSAIVIEWRKTKKVVKNMVEMHIVEMPMAVETMEVRTMEVETMGMTTMEVMGTTMSMQFTRSQKNTRPA
jgi:hypothetical protein